MRALTVLVALALVGAAFATTQPLRYRLAFTLPAEAGGYATLMTTANTKFPGLFFAGSKSGKAYAFNSTIAPRAILDLGADASIGAMALQPSKDRLFVGYSRAATIAERSMYAMDGAAPTHMMVMAAYPIDATTFMADGARGTQYLAEPAFDGNRQWGDMKFGANPSLLWFGFGAAATDSSKIARRSDNLLSSIMLINVDTSDARTGMPYSSVSTNPYANAAGYRSETNAYGFAHPVAFDWTADKTMWILDSLKGKSDEINTMDLSRGYSLGGDFGFSERHGYDCYFPATGCATMDARGMPMQAPRLTTTGAITLTQTGDMMMLITSNGAKWFKKDDMKVYDFKAVDRSGYGLMTTDSAFKDYTFTAACKNMQGGEYWLALGMKGTETRDVFTLRFDTDATITSSAASTVFSVLLAVVLAVLLVA